MIDNIESVLIYELQTLISLEKWSKMAVRQTLALSDASYSVSRIAARRAIKVFPYLYPERVTTQLPQLPYSMRPRLVKK
jgi:hypothetical protein